ncbi:hypothetical protein K466DRAFT_239906 [Polyporus arcularius HHB13444]|uniref:Uncharacterized protein n=1 Tax=Polyporus arcularius HHB13444 TaxID=1314778 RepID=A0A5C3PDR7_9APHY|nr:hypothetical protein K466DRAFT_239906 [Polyporus arcularius HHB13444]
MHSVQAHIANLTRALELEGRHMSLADINLAKTGLRANLVELNRLANSLAPVNQLPYDILAMIFKHVTATIDQNQFRYLVGEESDAPAVGTSYNAGRAAATISHVCSHWRHTAMATPRLWTHVDGRCHERVLVFLERARKIPVSLYLFTKSEALSTLLSLASLAEQLCRLDVLLEESTEDSDIAVLTSCVAPNLECLTLDAYPDYRRGRPVPLARIQMLGGKTTFLKALALRHIGNWMPSNTFPSLSHLHMTFEWEIDARTPDLLAVFANAPNLEFVYIGQQRYKVDTEPFHADPVVLNRLRCLTLDCCPYATAMDLLKHLSLPEHCFVQLNEVDIQQQEGEPRPLPQVGPLRHPTKLDVVSAEDELFLVADSDTSGFWLHAHLTSGSNTWYSWLHGLASMVALSSITSLHITFDPTHTFWSSVMRHFSVLTELKVNIDENLFDFDDVCPLDTLCAILMEDSPVLLPLLRDLQVEGTARGDDFKRCSSTIVDMVAFRARTGHRLRRFLLQPHDWAASLDGWFGARAVELLDVVDMFELVGNACRALCDFKMRDMWHVDGAEKYWQPHGTGAFKKYAILLGDH